VSQLTCAEIRDKKHLKKLLGCSCHATVFSNIFKSSNAKFFLIIYVDGKQFVKMHIYPLVENTVIKVIIEGDQISNDVLNALTNLASKMDVIHTSGFTFVQDHLIYELYIAKTIADQQLKEVQHEMMRLKAIDRVSLEEITPKHPSMVR
jgi:2-C-methyl-D-erythritol 4-phosphate cytidylyltransferase